MPKCGLIKDFKITNYSSHLDVSIHFVGNSRGIFTELAKAALPGVDVRPLRLPSSDWRITSEGIMLIERLWLRAVYHENAEEDLNSLLNVLTRCVTIEDKLDESHALSLHKIPAGDADNLRRSTIGNWVFQAKDYHGNLPFIDKSATKQITDRVIDFIRKHPRYRHSAAIAFAPSSKRWKTSTLPSTIAAVTARRLQKPLISPIRRVPVPARKNSKEIADQRNTVQIDQDLNRQRIIIIDDLYKSGTTIQEVARAARIAGASEVLGLTFTKTAKNTYGMSLGEWPWG